jgi:hypothetical protein
MAVVPRMTVSIAESSDRHHSVASKQAADLGCWSPGAPGGAVARDDLSISPPAAAGAKLRRTPGWGHRPRPPGRGRMGGGHQQKQRLLAKLCSARHPPREASQLTGHASLPPTRPARLPSETRSHASQDPARARADDEPTLRRPRPDRCRLIARGRSVSGCVRCAARERRRRRSGPRKRVGRRTPSSGPATVPASSTIANLVTFGGQWSNSETLGF